MSNFLFKGIVKDKTNADIGWVQDKSIFYAEGYKIAARELCKDHGQRCTREKDTLLFPIFFCTANI